MQLNCIALGRHCGARQSQTVLSQLKAGRLTSCHVAHLLDVREESNFQFISITA